MSALTGRRGDLFIDVVATPTLSCGEEGGWSGREYRRWQWQMCRPPILAGAVREGVGRGARAEVTVEQGRVLPHFDRVRVHPDGNVALRAGESEAARNTVALGQQPAIANHESTPS